MQMRQTLCLTQKQTLRLSQAQRLRLKTHVFAMRLSLIGDLHGERYEPKATCPACKRELTAVEIIGGFNQDTQDFTTCCSGCRQRFEPKLICFGDGSQIQLPFYCGVQTLAQLRGKEVLDPRQFLKDAPAIYRSAIIHYGSLHNAFVEVGIVYPFGEVEDWKDKIIPFLGRLPDTTIAECVNVCVANIRKLRKELGVTKYVARKALDEAS
ncbi:MAG: hypothetical protein HZB12_01675 [Candidatus Yonathbacteria bacterium]|nr:hypothetical protein [Candidatus Yonathbacteria bacterium]